MIFERDRLEAGRKRYSLQNATVFREEEHPRSEDGKFGTGGNKKPAFETDSEKIKKMIEGRKEKTETKTDLLSKIKNPTARKMAETAFSSVSKYIDTLPEIETTTGMKDYARYSPSNDKIYISTKINSSAVENLKQGTERGFYTQENPVLHELGHYLAYKLDPEGFDRLKNMDWTPQEKEMLKKNISEYATTNGSELIAEYASGVMSGRKYPKEVNDFINKTIGWKGKGGFFGLIDSTKSNSSPVKVYRASR